MKKNILTILWMFLLTIYSCNNEPVYDEESIWVLKNEMLLNKELEKRITDDLAEKDTDTSWFKKSIVVTKYDTTILGLFAKRLNKLSECFEIEYSFSKNFNEKKTITILNDSSNGCNILPTKSFLVIDSTEHFKILH
jgi:hypothetical protein